MTASVVFSVYLGCNHSTTPSVIRWWCEDLSRDRHAWSPILCAFGYDRITNLATCFCFIPWSFISHEKSFDNHPTRCCYFTNQKMKAQRLIDHYDSCFYFGKISPTLNYLVAKRHHRHPVIAWESQLLSAWDHPWNGSLLLGTWDLLLLVCSYSLWVDKLTQKTLLGTQ